MRGKLKYYPYKPSKASSVRSVGEYMLRAVTDAPISASCYRQKSTRYKIRIRDRAKYILVIRVLIFYGIKWRTGENNCYQKRQHFSRNLKWIPLILGTKN